MLTKWEFNDPQGYFTDLASMDEGIKQYVKWLDHTNNIKSLTGSRKDPIKVAPSTHELKADPHNNQKQIKKHMHNTHAPKPTYSKPDQRETRSKNPNIVLKTGAGGMVTPTWKGGSAQYTQFKMNQSASDTDKRRYRSMLTRNGYINPPGFNPKKCPICDTDGHTKNQHKWIKSNFPKLLNVQGAEYLQIREKYRVEYLRVNSLNPLWWDNNMQWICSDANHPARSMYQFESSSAAHHISTIVEHSDSASDNGDWQM